MGKTYHNYLGKNRIHENARPYERTRERIVDDIHTAMEEVSFFWNEQKEELKEEK